MKRTCYSNIEKYDSPEPINPIQDPYITIGIPSVFIKMGKIPDVLNVPDIKDTKQCPPKRYKTQGSI